MKATICTDTQESYFLCSFRPLAATWQGNEAATKNLLPPFIDGSCRREPDFQSKYPSISALCRSMKFAPRLRPNDHVAYISVKGRYEKEDGWRLVALLQVVNRFESHAEAASWYQDQGLPIPSNCMVEDSKPQPYEYTNQLPPKQVAARITLSEDTKLAVRLWDATYAGRARECGVFLVCRAEYLELHAPPILRRSDFIEIFGRVPGTQNPPSISASAYRALMPRGTKA